MYIGYFDEFGHNGAYVARNDSKYKTHPIFGIGGIILPAHEVRNFSGAFKRLKERHLDAEIKAKVLDKGRNLNHWEKKGSALLTTQNVERYPEVKTLIFRTINLINKHGGYVSFYAQQKNIGGPDDSAENNTSRYDHTMRQLITRVNGDLPGTDQLLMILDEQGDTERLDIYVGAAAFMFSNVAGQRLIEPPMQVESHLYQTVQAADWICALLGRISAYKFDSEFADFEWSVKYFGERLSQICLPSSKVLGLDSSDNRANLHPNALGNSQRCFAPFSAPVSPEQLQLLVKKFH